jgi:uncharacterized protein
MRRAAVVLLALLAVFGPACSGDDAGPVSSGGDAGVQTSAAPHPPDVPEVRFPTDRVTVSFGEGAEVRAEVAVTPEQIARGLMYRKRLPADDGMLFLFQTTHADGFYMKNTLVPLSIAYMRRTATRTYQVVAILDMKPCPASKQDCPTYPPGAYYDATLEVNTGWFDRHDVSVGSAADVAGPIPNPFDLPFSQVTATPG